MPSAPLLALSGDDALVSVRDAAQSVVAEIVAHTTTSITVLADGEGAAVRDESAGGTLREYGLDVHAGGEQIALGLGHTIGAWLLDRAGWRGRRRYATDVDSPDGTVLVVADGAACVETNSPRGFDPRGPGFQNALLASLGSADAALLASLDLEVAAELWCSGAAVLSRVGRATQERTWRGEMRYAGAPLGVGYWVALWRSP
ncbi:hypothetical protein [Aeromicrobium phragmitis]|uniref:hypothetical protein n=1 Tax=Aeromicrobium phragmitis TaxID=2478914 RepID=UPI0010605C9B|nr:hypothetical protein [Aeromicrobium phragmitis]